MFAKQGPKVRNACEDCHSRKTKCVIGQDGGACMACKANNRECYFKPRFKSGRPYSTASARERNNASRGTRSSDFETSLNTSPIETPEPPDYQDLFKTEWSIDTFGPVHNGDGGLAQGGNDSGGSQNYDLSNLGFQIPTEAQRPTNLQNLPFLNSMSNTSSLLQSPTGNFSAVSEFGFPITGGLNNGPGTSLSSSSAENSGSVGSASSLTHRAPTVPNGGPRSRGSLTRPDNTNGQVSPLTLEQCMELQQELESVQQALADTDETVPQDEMLHSISATMSLNCEKISTTVRRSVSSKSTLTIDLALLIILMIRKALGLSSIFTQLCVRCARSLQSTLFLKRLECNIIDLHISLSSIKQQQPTLAAVSDDGLKDLTAILLRLQDAVAEMGRR